MKQKTIIKNLEKIRTQFNSEKNTRQELINIVQDMNSKLYNLIKKIKKDKTEVKKWLQ